MKRTALIFSGQGAQHVGMGKDLADQSPVAQALYKLADSALNRPLSQICFEGPESTLTDTSYCQPALYVHGFALWQLLKERMPSLVIQATAGLSLGEFTAHAAAGRLSFEDGLGLVAIRGRLMQEACETTQGGMLTLIGATEEQAIALASASGLEAANFNCPGQIVLSGEKALIPAAVEKAKDFNLKRVIPLNVAGAYHSKLMLSAQEGLKPALEKVTLSDGLCPTYSNVTGEPTSGEAAIRDTLLRQVTGSVRWQSCIENMIRDGIERFIELGPGKVLSGMCKRINKDIPCHTAGNFQELETLIHELT